jgi:hypothetical protein
MFLSFSGKLKKSTSSKISPLKKYTGGGGSTKPGRQLEVKAANVNPKP